MILLIIGGIVYALWADSIPASIITAALIVYRSRRPSPISQRIREAWYQRQAAGVGADSEDVR